MAGQMPEIHFPIVITPGKWIDIAGINREIKKYYYNKREVSCQKWKSYL